MSSAATDIKDSKLPVITLSLPKLYHTALYNDGSETVLQLIKENIEAGQSWFSDLKVGHYFDNISVAKSFTIHPESHYSIERHAHCHKFLTYTTKATFKLLDIRAKGTWSSEAQLLALVAEQKLDGYLAKQDTTEVYLADPASKVVAGAVASDIPHKTMNYQQRLLQEDVLMATYTVAPAK